MKGQIYENRGGFVVRFGRSVSRWFKTRPEAERFLTGLRYEMDKGTFDLRDYAKDKPLAVSNLVTKYLAFKKTKVKPASFRNINNYLTRAADAWGEVNIKNIGYAEIEDLLWAQDFSDKTRADMKSALMPSGHGWSGGMSSRRCRGFPRSGSNLAGGTSSTWRHSKPSSTRWAGYRRTYRLRSPWVSVGLQRMCPYGRRKCFH